MNKPITTADMFRKLTADFEKMAREAAWERKLKRQRDATREFLAELEVERATKTGIFAPLNPVVRTRHANDDLQGDYEISGSHTNGEHGS
jgi:hypothetical protein